MKPTKKSQDNAALRDTLLIVEDHQAVRELLRDTLGARLGLKVIEAGDMVEGLAQARRHRPRLAIVDLGLPGANGIEFLRRLRRECAATRSLVFTSLRNPQIARGLVQAGAHGFVEKTSSLTQLKLAASAILAGRSWFDETFHRHLAEALSTPGPDHQLAVLTPREREVLLLVAQSHSSKEVSGKLGVSIKTAENHRSNLMRKLGLHDTAALVRLAIRHRLVDENLN